MGEFGEIAALPHYAVYLKALFLLTLSAFICHWLACLMVIVSTDGFLTSYNVADSHWQQYLVGLYWAMTTITTVGYGDVLPGSDEERGLAMFAMVVGGTFYGYVVGSMVSLIHQLNLPQEACMKKMQKIHAWIDFHNFPRSIRLRVWHHFKMYFNQNDVVEDAAGIMECLPPGLQDTVSELIVDESVRCNPLFDNITSVFTRIAQILQQITVGKETRVVCNGEPGRHMFIIRHGKVRLERGRKFTSSPSVAAITQRKGQPQTLAQHNSQLLRSCILKDGDSFGEEIILGVEDCYYYTVTTISEVTMYTISETSFTQKFEFMPEALGQMRENFMSHYLSWTNLMTPDPGKL